ncbi:MAG: nuclear transport factor 2 family protein [Acidimicrobiales bacterium]|nr:nuclear transport factor 2 family protein [Acidimicrobiales bacterium]
MAPIIATVPDADCAAQINAALLTYCRGVDRLDEEALLAAFHPGAMLEGYAAKSYPVERFAPFAMTSLAATYAATQHRISNVAIEQHGDRARVESYVVAYHVTEPPERRLITFCGRYVDDFERIGGRWLIRTRRLRKDWDAVQVLEGSMSDQFVAGARDRSDAVYQPL